MENKNISIRLNLEDYKRLEAKGKEQDRSAGQEAKAIILEALGTEAEATEKETGDSSETASEPKESHVNEKLINTLQMDIEAKNRQIEDLQTIVKQQQSLQLSLQSKLPEIEEPKPKDERGFFKRLFNLN